MTGRGMGKTTVSFGRVYDEIRMHDNTDNEMSSETQKELVANTVEQKNWRGIAIALLVIVIVCAFIITAIVLMTPSTNEQNLGSPFTLHDFFDENIKPKDFPVQWAKAGDKFYYRNEEGSLLEYDCASNTTTLIMDNVTFRNLDTGHYTVSPDRQYVMLKHDVIPIFRHSTLASYSLYDINTKSMKKLTGQYGATFQYVEWSPRHGHSLVIVQDNNIYYKANVEDDQNPTPLTHTGMPGIIYNGIPDWIYEEEIFSTDHALWWSPDGVYLCYAIFNNTMVHKYYYPVYSDYNHPYAQVVTIPYPKPGFPNPTVSLQIVKMGEWSKVTIQTPNEFLNKEHYITKVMWKDKENIWVCWLNRAQNFSVMSICHASTGQCQISIREEGHGGWFKLQGNPVFPSSGNKYFMILPQKHTELGYFKHIAIVDNKNANIDDRKYFLMYIKWEVTDLVAYDEVDKLVYFIGTGGDPRRRHLYSVGLDKKLTCLSCDLDEKCQFVNARFSPSVKYYILGCLGPTVPYYSLRAVGGDSEIKRLENNTALGLRLAKVALPRVENFQIELDNGEKLWGRLLLPPKLNKEETLLYPLVLHVYGAPGTQKVTEKFGTGWETYLTSSKDFIYALVDARGSGGRGEKFLHEVYRKLGKKQVDDVITAAKYYSKLSYVDTQKMAIWGWSYGGFLALSVLGRGTGIFPCGISVAPVTDWIYYDSVYTERFMGMPTGDDNIQAYKESNVSNFAENFKKTKLLLVHGTGDDNVHFQHTAQLMKTLNEHNTYYRTQIYPDKHHGLLGGNTRRHLYETLEDFLDECFTGVSTKFGNVALIPVEET
ncbi:dipeptidyl peptidase 4-like isoform X3 [Gigantopelta aegis]|uniref:dipeptidyl peptidase 4-like isoform X3 n=1 Tax=Gigantopelta aegis TaxID=1735272 RepID=UPI001B88D056|nr:dipeptidyl peptidase 4-like isoform X3 [Gigantopelta aegis]